MMNRIAIERDLNEIIAIDELAIRDEARRDYILSWIQNECAVIAVLDERIVGYVVLEYTFFSNGFIPMLFVHHEYRRKGVASNLLKSVEEMCETEKIFTSTNKSNIAMQKLMSLNSYESSGVVYNLDEGDPELFYFKKLSVASK